MFKRKNSIRIFILLPLLLFSFNLKGFAEVFVDKPYFGVSEPDGMTSILFADDSKTITFSDVTVHGMSRGWVYWYDSSGMKISEDIVDSAGSFNAPIGAYGFAIKLNADGGELHANYATLNDEFDTQWSFDITPSSDGGSSGGTGVVKIDGWDDHMSKLNQILAAIPPPPNWNQVAGTFRDTILPKLKQDLQEVLGTAPTPPAAPGRPTTPDSSSGLNDGGLTAPTGGNAPGLSGSGFSLDDLKNGSPTINERSDPTGGFTINDPTGGLPTQEEFMENIPGNPPVIGIEEPTFSEPIFTEPTFTEPTYTEPTYTEPTYTEPTFSEPTIGQEPMFTEPTGDYDTFPTPTTGGDTGEPLTGDYDTAPIPSNDWNPPIPGS